MTRPRAADPNADEATIRADTSSAESAAGALLVLAVFSLGYLVSYLFRGINISLAPSTMRDTGMDASALGLVTSMYFLGFALAQVPAGILLDRYGARRTEAALLVLAAAGSVVFGATRSPALLMLSRAMIGVGVSICLAGAFKAIAERFPARKLPALNGLVLAAGGLGGVLTGSPAVWAAGRSSRWTICLALAVLTLATAVALMLAPAAPTNDNGQATFADQLRGTWTILRSRFFWRVAPFSVISQGVFYAAQSLWAAGYMEDVSGFKATSAAGLITVIGLAQMVGSGAAGVVARWLAERGVGLVAFSGLCMAAFVLDQILIVADVGLPAWLLWGGYGLLGPTGALTYAVVTAEFPVAMAGRVNTTLTLLLFVAVFLFQWGIGFVVSFWPVEHGHHAAIAHRAAWAILVVVELAAASLYLSPRLRAR